MKADKGNCFVVIDRSDYDSKMETLLNNRFTYEEVSTSPFRQIERELNGVLLSLKRHQKIDEPTYRKLHSIDGTSPAICRSVKPHKEGNSPRPIVTCIGSALYNISKFLTDILSLLQSCNRQSVADSLQFSKELSDIEIDDNEVFVVFDVISLFTGIAVDKACEYIKKKLEQDATLSLRTNLTSPQFLNSPCPRTILCSMTEFTNKLMAVRWAVLSALLWPIFAWRRLKGLQSVNHSFSPKFGKGMLTIVFVSLQKTTSRPSKTH